MTEETISQDAAAEPTEPVETPETPETPEVTETPEPAPVAVAETIRRSVDCGMVGGSIEDRRDDTENPFKGLAAPVLCT